MSMLKSFSRRSAPLLAVLPLLALAPAPAQAARIQFDVIGFEVVVEVCVTYNGQTYCDLVPVG